MQQIGEYRIAADRETVWAALNDPDVLGRCITGAQEVTRLDDEHFDVKVKAKVGPVSATFQAALTLSDLVPPESYTIQGNVKGGAAGFAKGGADVSLMADGDDTLLRYEVNGSVGGKLAQVGSRLVDGAARKMADEFFAAFSNHLNPEAAADPSQSHDADSDAAPVAYESDGQWKIWAIAFVVLLLAIVLTL